jgi:hypothetical protein
MLLKEKKLWGIVLGTKVKLTMNFVAWKNKDSKVRTFIIMGLHNSLLQICHWSKNNRENLELSPKSI